MTVQITAPHFVAALEVEDDLVIMAAPIVNYMIGWDYYDVIQHCDSHKWKIKVLEQ